VTARIVLQLRWATPRYKVREGLARLLHLHLDTHAAILTALYQYVKVRC
jgi:hypothetical protein